ncbi:thioredoxin-like protein [Crucibulum laeve]|uniref:glutathione transferase n=1 Tax=Crucibulum laeve TaxID=68775 RepID=A0A5C3LS34_9AGAR|nr:thioredoxin-like protein [Crucibulum laeve]
MPSTNTGSIVVHHLADSRSQRILWLLEELELPYEIKRYERTPEGRAPKELFHVHPLGKSPVITDGEVTLAESGAIVQYIITKYGQDKVKVPEAGYIDDLYYSHYAEGSFQEHLVRKRIFNSLAVNAKDEKDKETFQNLIKTLVDPELETHAKLIEAHLANSPSEWFAGGPTPTSADYLLGFSLEILVNRAPQYVGPKIQAYVRNFEARPAYKRGIEKGGEYAYLLSSA